jgi:maltokinase
LSGPGPRAGPRAGSGAGASAADAALREALGAVVCAYCARRPGWGMDKAPEEATVRDAVVLLRGRPGLLDVVAEAGGRLVHVPVGLRTPDDPHLAAADGDEALLGTVDDGDGTALAFDALRDSETAALLLAHVSGSRSDPALVRLVRQDISSTTVAMEDRFSFTVFDELAPGPRPELDVLFALDAAGFNHLAAPLFRWRRRAWDLGVVQEHLAGPTSGRALALTSVRDLYATGGPPEMAGGDFGAEAHRLGTMAARLHLAAARAYGRRPVGVEVWAGQLHEALAARGTQLERPDVLAVLSELRALPSAGVAVRTHGDFHLGRLWRIEQGWYVGDFSPAGWPPSPLSGPPAPLVEEEGVPYRPPLADVADVMWSFAHVATSAANERDPAGREGLDELAQAWEQRNRRSFLDGYLGVPGITELVPASREAVRVVVAAFEVEVASR